MDVSVRGLPPNTGFDFFVIQVPKPPFGVSWYQGDIETDKHGRGHQHFIGRFSVETFAVAPGTAPAPVVFDGPFTDATPFNGEHTAGIQVLNTSNFPDDHGPLRDVIPEKD
jgi:hypothetical protein